MGLLREPWDKGRNEVEGLLLKIPGPNKWCGNEGLWSEAGLGPAMAKPSPPRPLQTLASQVAWLCLWLYLSFSF